MKLNRLTERIWIYPFEEERDRPNLGYVRGDRRSLAVDAGHSDAHVREFYGALEAAGLPLPDLTVLTHWHWDHTFGMHAVHGLTLANARTDQYLRQFRERVRGEGDGVFLALHESIRGRFGDKVVFVDSIDDHRDKNWYALKSTDDAAIKEIAANMLMLTTVMNKTQAIGERAGERLLEN